MCLKFPQAKYTSLSLLWLPFSQTEAINGHIQVVFILSLQRDKSVRLDAKGQAYVVFLGKKSASEGLIRGTLPQSQTSILKTILKGNESGYM